MEKSDDAISKMELDTDTNLLVSPLANTEKIKPKNEQIHYEDEKDKNIANAKIESCMKETCINNDINENNDEVNYVEQKNNVEDERQSIQPPQANLGNQLSLKTDEDVDEYDIATPVRKRLMKLDMLRKLSELINKGVKLTQHYDMNSDYKLMKFEYELHKSIREKHGTVLFLQDGCISAVGMLESANKKYNALGLNLDGWSDSVSGKQEQLYDAFGSIYEKYSGPGRSVPPELMLLGILGFSAARTHMANTALSNTETIEDKNKTDPNFLTKIRNQALGINQTNNDSQKPFYENKLDKQHNNANTDAEAYREYLKMEEEHKQQNLQQPTMKPPSLPFQMKQSNIQEPEMQTQHPLLNIQQQRMMKNLTPSNMTSEQFNNFRTDEIKRQRDIFEKQLNEYNKNSKNIAPQADEISQQSEMSTIEVNPDINNILRGVDELSHTSKNKNLKKKRKTKNNKTLKVNV